MDPIVWLRKHLEEADTDLLREMARTFIQTLMSAEADALCGAPYGERSPERSNRRNGYRPRPFDTRAGTLDLSVPKLRTGSYFPSWLLEPRRRAERALVQVGGGVLRQGGVHPAGGRADPDAGDRGDLQGQGRGE